MARVESARPGPALEVAAVDDAEHVENTILSDHVNHDTVVADTEAVKRVGGSLHCSDSLATGAVAATLRAERAHILELAAGHGARNVRVFGSVARGDEHATSDVDFLVDLAPGRTLLDLVGLRLALEDLLAIDVDVTTLDMVKPAAREAVSLQAVPL